MRSIRLSLIVYFLVLLTAGLVGVSLLAYHNTEKTLHDKEHSTTELVETQYRQAVAELHQEQDQKLVRRAKLFVSKYSNSHGNKAVHAVTVLTSPLQANGALLSGMWLREGASSMFYKLYNTQPLDHFIDWLDEDDDWVTVYCQTLFASGQNIWQRSSSMKDGVFFLEKEFRDKAEVYEERFDDVDFMDKKLRRLSLKVPLIRPFQPAPWGQWGGGSGGSFRPKGSGKGKSNQTPKPPPPPPSRMSFFETYYYVMFAVDTDLMEENIEELKKKRDDDLEKIRKASTDGLRQVGGQLLSISLGTFVAILVGGYFLIWIGLAPLRRLGEAVSRVSKKDFRLRMDAKAVPVELKPIVERLSQTLEQLRKAFAHEKQAAQDISHELRTPLAALTTTIAVALKKPRSTAEYQEMLEECQLSTKQMTHLVERLLELAKVDSGVVRLTQQRFDLCELAHECVGIVKPLAAAKDVAIQAHHPESLLVEADPHKLHEVISNLLSNAVEYNRSGGRIDLTIAPKGREVSIIVADTGIGISPEARPRIFERFYRVDPSRYADTPHCGLGLAIVKSYIDLMNGTIEVQSSEAGTTFRIRLPVRMLDSLDQHLQVLSK